MTRTLRRPEPILGHRASPVDREVPPDRAAARLLDGDPLIVSDYYSTGAEILAQLEVLMRPPPQDAGHGPRRAYQRAFREAAMRLLVSIVDHRPALTGAQRIGFIEELYPDLSAFSLPFPQLQELHGAWELYIDGVHLPVLGHRVHPMYGTYAPTRLTHLELFGTWLSAYQGPRERAIDVGTGCGVLALMLCKGGFERVLATDINPNAVESVERELRRLPSKPPIETLHGDLLSDIRGPVDLIVFNPPWTRGEPSGLIDGALYYEDGLFERFFEQASQRLTPAGRIVLVFSNLISLVQPDVPHPITTELERGRLRLVSKQQRKVKATPTRDGRRRKTREKVEVWELAVT